MIDTAATPKHRAAARRILRLLRTAMPEAAPHYGATTESVDRWAEELAAYDPEETVVIARTVAGYLEAGKAIRMRNGGRLVRFPEAEDMAEICERLCQ